MDISNLWEKLEPKPCNLEAIRLASKQVLFQIYHILLLVMKN